MTEEKDLEKLKIRINAELAQVTTLNNKH